MAESSENDFVDGWMAIIMAAIHAEGIAVGEEIELDLVENLSTPVQPQILTTSTGRTTAKLQRSQKGEYPRQESGKLRNSIGNAVTVDGDGPDTVTIDVFTDDNLQKVEKLEGPLGRLLIGATFVRWSPIVEERFAGLTF